MYLAFSGASIPMIQCPSQTEKTVKGGVVTGLVLNVPRRAASTLPRASRAAAPGRDELQPRQGQEPDQRSGEDPARHPMRLVWQPAHPVDNIAGRPLEARARIDLLAQPCAPA
jgi:hypothetical protein